MQLQKSLRQVRKVLVAKNSIVHGHVMWIVLGQAHILVGSPTPRATDTAS